MSVKNTSHGFGIIEKVEFFAASHADGQKWEEEQGMLIGYAVNTPKHFGNEYDISQQEHELILDLLQKLKTAIAAGDKKNLKVICGTEDIDKVFDQILGLRRFLESVEKAEVATGTRHNDRSELLRQLKELGQPVTDAEIKLADQIVIEEFKSVLLARSILGNKVWGELQEVIEQQFSGLEDGAF